MHNLMKNDRDIQRIAKQNKSILQGLMEELQIGTLKALLNKRHGVENILRINILKWLIVLRVMK
jgi:hypothetical protein